MIGSVLQQHYRGFTIVFKKNFRSEATWFFKATAKHDLCVLQIPGEFDDEDNLPTSINLWARVAPPRRTERLTQDFDYKKGSLHNA